MALDVYFQEDIAQSIVAVAVGMLSAAAAHGATNVEYCRGVVDTVRAQALNYSIPWPRLQRELRDALANGGQTELLDLVNGYDIFLQTTNQQILAR
jgi:hypothetical protein